MATEQQRTNDHNAPPLLASSTQPLSAPHTVNIGTRKSQLARVQTDIVVAQLQRVWPQHTYNIHAISTMGDLNQVTALHSFGDKGLWTHELEAMLINGDVDFIVHSLKDIPTQLPQTCKLGTILAREDPRDALIFKPHLASQTPPPKLSTLPPGSVIGTSSVRRSAQLSRLYPHLQFQSVRGNINTRLSKLDDPESPYSAIILAAAGLIRIDLGHRISGFLESSNAEGVVASSTPLSSSTPAQAAPPNHNHTAPNAADNHEKADPLHVGGAPPPPMVQNVTEEAAHDAEARQRNIGDRRWGMLHAVGQGALGLEVRREDARTAELLAPLADRATTLACLAERSLMRALEGGCSVPIGVETEWEGQGGATGLAGVDAETLEGRTLTMRAIVVSLDGARAAEASLTRKGVGSAEDAEVFGRDVANALVERGAEAILSEINVDRNALAAPKKG